MIMFTAKLSIITNFHTFDLSLRSCLNQMSVYSLAMSSVEENISFCSLNKIQTQLAVLMHEFNEPQLVLNKDSSFTSCERSLSLEYVLFCNSILNLNCA